MSKTWFITGASRGFGREWALAVERDKLKRQIRLVDAVAESARSLNKQLGKSDREKMAKASRLATNRTPIVPSSRRMMNRIIGSPAWAGGPGRSRPGPPAPPHLPFVPVTAGALRAPPTQFHMIRRPRRPGSRTARTPAACRRSSDGC